MIETLIGLFLIIGSLFFLFSEESAHRRLLLIIGGWFTVFFIIGYGVQAMSVFTYPIILTVSVIVFLFLLYKEKPWKYIHRYTPLFKKIDWYVLGIVAISIILLSSVHYSYNGEYSILSQAEYVQADNLVYLYPYYSDEWYAISFAQDATEHNTLPTYNPLTPERTPVVNFELPFHTLVSSMLLFFDLDPLTQYVQLSIIISTLIIVAIYALLRGYDVGAPIAAVVAASALFITNGANLPGLWTLIPVSVGLLYLLASLGYLKKNIKKSLFFAFMALVFYPPLVVFLSAAYAGHLWQEKSENEKHKKTAVTTGIQFIFVTFFAALTAVSHYIIPIAPPGKTWVAPLLVLLSFVGVYFALYKSDLFQKGARYFMRYRVAAAIFATFIFVFLFLQDISATKSFVRTLTNVLVYKTFTSNAIPQYAPHHIVPFISLIALPFAAMYIWKKARWLFAVLITGGLFWVVYSSVYTRIIIEYQRVVFVTAVFIVIASGFSIKLIISRFKISDLVVKMGAIFIFLVILWMGVSGLYTKDSTWKELILVDQISAVTYPPAAPANKYLYSDDIRIFGELDKRRFLSLEWKGAVIGVATNNYPLSTKPGTITINSGLPAQFWQGDCEKKQEIAKNFKLDYVYLPQFKCDGFIEKERSVEGLVLYRVSL